MGLIITKIGDSLFQHQKDGGAIIRDNAPNATSQDNLTDFKTRNGANLYLKVDYSDVTVIDVYGGTGTFTFASLSDMWDKLIELNYFDGASSGSGSGGIGVTRFDNLVDAFTYPSNNGKVPVVNTALNKLVPTTFYNVAKFEDLSNTPVSLVANKIPMVSADGLELVWVEMPSEPQQFYNAYGFITYDGDSTTYPYASGDLTVLNSAVGALTDNTFRPYGVVNLWSSFNNQFVFSDLTLGDKVTLNIDVDIVSTVINQNVKFKLRYAIGSGSEKTIVINDLVLSDISVNNTSFNSILEMSVDNIINYPAELLFESDNACDVVVGLFKIEAIRRDVNNVIITDTDSKADHYIETWNASTNTPTLIDGIGQIGDYYPVSVAGTFNSIVFGVNDVIKYNGATWYKSVDNNQTNTVEPNTVTITTIVNITSATLSDGGYSQDGKNVIIKNGAAPINLELSTAVTATYILRGTGDVTFTEGGSRTNIDADGTFILSGTNSTAAITPDGTENIIMINNR